MFLSTRKYKTPISTYADSYRPPCSYRKTSLAHGLQLLRHEKYLTKGLGVPPVSQNQGKQQIQAAMPEYYRNTVNPAAYWPEKYWLARSEEKYNPVFAHEVKYVTWRTGPYNSTAWKNHSCYVPFLPKETRMEILLHGIPMPYTLKPTCPNQCERDTVIGMLQSVTGMGILQGYHSPCSGRHYCLGMDYYVDGWDSSHFQKIGGVQRGSYVICPDFASENCSALWH
ncbi:LOW QUALITY PROTEIN: sperm microtubule inner protein 6 [Podargus strigoides]